MRNMKLALMVLILKVKKEKKELVELTRKNILIDI